MRRKKKHKKKLTIIIIMFLTIFFIYFKSYINSTKSEKIEKVITLEDNVLN
jgi:PDZ domain-containing secreted protein